MSYRLRDERRFWTAVVNGFVAPPLLFAIMLIVNDQKVMGARTNGRLLNVPADDDDGGDVRRRDRLVVTSRAS